MTFYQTEQSGEIVEIEVEEVEEIEEIEAQKEGETHEITR